MTTLEYEGATEGITENQFKFIGEVLENRGFTNKKVQIEVVGIPGDNYMANIRRFIIQNEDGTQFKMVAKLAPHIEEMRLIVNTRNIFLNEHMMYTKVLPKFKSMQIAADVPKADMLRFAECYGSYMEEPNEVILLEDLKDSNFIMLDRLKSLSDDCIRSVLRNMAILHSLSYALKYKEPETFEKFTHELYNVWSNMNAVPDLHIFFESIGNNAFKLISDNKQRATVFKGAWVGNIPSCLFELSKADANSRHNVIQQGDAWTNNFMFKFDGDTLLESIMIDYQISREGRPICDVLYMIFNCTDHQTRLKQYNEWIEYYHTELDKNLSNFNLKAIYVYSRDQLDVDLKRYAKVMFALSVVMSNTMTLTSEDAAKLQKDMGSEDVTTISEKLMTLDSATAFKARVEDLIDSSVEFGLL